MLPADDYAHRAITVTHHDEATGQLVLSCDTCAEQWTAPQDAEGCYEAGYTFCPAWCNS